jgi:hypothetical protein
MSEFQGSARPYRAPMSRGRLFVARVVALLILLGVAGVMSRSPPLELLGFWLVAGLVIGGVVWFAYRAGKRMVGPASADVGKRDAALALALVLACLVSPKATLQAADFLAGACRALFVESPVLLSQANTPGGGPRQILACWTREGACLTSMHPMTSGQPASTASAGAAPEASTADAMAWIWFILAAIIVLLVSRAILQAKEDFKSADPRDADRRNMLSYPTWISLCVYAAILAPAAYFSVGSLLYLDLDTPSSSLASISETLDVTERQALESLPGVELNTDALEQVVTQRLPPGDPRLENLTKAIGVGRASTAAITSGRRVYKSNALENANGLKASATAGQFEDYRLLLTANYGRVINQTRLAARPCLERLAQLHEAINQARPIEIAAAAPPAGEPGANTGASSEAQPPVEAAVWSREIDNAVNACQEKVTFPDAPSPVALTEAHESFPGVAYGWLAKSSQATVLIVGLVGFGLFGAAIRMMGRPDKMVDPEANGVTDATGRVFVQGLGAAFTVFLVGQAGMDLLSIGGRPNAFGLLLFCFIGAVFAEEIWRAMNKLLTDKTQGGGAKGGSGAADVPPQPAPRPIPKPPAEPAPPPT